MLEVLRHPEKIFAILGYGISLPLQFGELAPYKFFLQVNGSQRKQRKESENRSKYSEGSNSKPSEEELLLYNHPNLQ